jgi:ubiquinone/menaquinone biosynthesis C-methylase UbiE
VDPKAIVARGYDKVAPRYFELVEHEPAGLRQHYAHMLMGTFPKGATLLELGCGSGIPATELLARHFRVTGVDLSGRQIESARTQVPNATFLQGDMAALDFPAATFDVVTAFYSIIHLPRAEHPVLLGNVATWLKSGGYLVATMGISCVETGMEADWLGVPMFWSSYDSSTNKRPVQNAGLELVEAEEITTESALEEDQPETFFWVVARKPTH